MRRMAAAGRVVRMVVYSEGNPRAMLTSVGNLARITTCALVAVVGESGADLAERLECGAISRPFILCQCDFFLLTGLGVFDGDSERYNLVVEPASFLSSLRTLIRLGCEFVLYFPWDIKFVAHIL